MKRLILLILYFIIAGCASTPTDSYTELQAKTQCPIGYHLEQKNSVALFNEKSETNKNTIEFSCVVDLNQDDNKNTRRN
jgi:carbamate kinase